jgi:5-methylcytosine-specific restriction endonuclease McrA
MNITQIKRPWESNKWGGKSFKSDPYYQSIQWKNLRSQHRKGVTLVNGVELSNELCVECFRLKNRIVPGSACDHIIARVDGGSDTLENLQTLCDTHHARKSNQEKNQRK